MAVAQTSALDAHTEAELMRNINSMLADKSRTSIFIAHRLRTVVESGKPTPLRSCGCMLTHYSCSADLIIVLKDGEVFERGTHEELIRMRGLYWSMWQEQAADIFQDESPETTA